MSAPSRNLQRKMNNTANIISSQKSHLLPGLYNKYPEDYLDLDTHNSIMINKPWIESVINIKNWVSSHSPLQLSVVTGGDKILVICVDFSDKPASVPTSTIYNRFFDTTGNTFKNYYNEVSHGLYIPDGIVIGWYRAPQTYAYYRDSPGCNYGRGAYPHNVDKLFEDILDLVNNDPSVTDTILSELDIDGNGVLNRIIIVHAGGEASHTGNCNEIWACARLISPKIVKGKTFITYAITSEYIDDPSDIQRSGIACHEFGHLLGLQDLYDENTGNSIVGIWSLMDYGAWGITDDGIIPTHLDARSKALLGWITISNQTGLVSAENIENYYIAYVYITTNPGEYFMIENRQKIGFDRDLPGSGLLIWHINETKDQTDINCRKVYLIQADNRRDIENKINPGDIDDPYPGETNNRSFNITSSPNSLLCDGTNSYLDITNISDSEAIMSMTITRNSVNILSTPPGARIWLDNIDQQTVTPHEIIDIYPGDHTYTLRLAGFQDYTGNFTVTGTTVEISVILSTDTNTNTGNVSFMSIPFGARIWIDNIDRQSNTPKGITDIPIGIHTYTLKLEGYRDVTGNFTVVAGTTTDISVTIILINVGYVSFTSIPSGARIWIDDVDTGRNTPNILTVFEGSHTFRLTFIGYQDATGNFSVIAGITTEVSTILIAGTNTGNVSFTSIPSGAEIWIDNIDRNASTPYEITDITPGTHTFTLKLAGYQDAAGVFSIGSGYTTIIPTVTLVTYAEQESNARLFGLLLDTGIILFIKSLYDEYKKEKKQMIVH